MYYIFEELAGIFFLAQIILFLVVFVKLSGLRRDLDALGTKPAPKSTQKPQKVAAKDKLVKRKTAEPSTAGLFMDWMKKDFLMKLGAFLVILAIAWFVRYSFLNNWVGPVGRIAMGMVAGAGILTGGYVNLKKRPVPGQVLVVLGTTTILLTTFAARTYYDFFTPASAIGIMSFTILLTAVISVLHKIRALAVIALLGGVAAPLMSGGDSDSDLFLSTYMFILSLGVFGVVALRGWRSLALMALLAVSFYVGAIGMFNSLTDNVVWLFMILFYALFFVGGASAYLHSKNIRSSDLATTLITTLIAIWWSLEFVPEEWQSVVLACTAIASITVSLMLKYGGSPAKSIYLNGLAAIVLLGAGTAIEFDGEIQTIVFALEVLAFVAMSVYILEDRKAATTAALLHIIPGTLAVQSFGNNWTSEISVLNEKFFVLLTMVAAFTVTALLLNQLPRKTQEDKDSIKSGITVSAVAAVTFLFALIWRSLEMFMDNDYAHGTALVLYTIVGLVLFFNGVVKHKKNFRFGGIAILALVLLRLLLVELWNMSLVERIITFVVIGILFIATAFFEKRTK